MKMINKELLIGFFVVFAILVDITHGQAGTVYKTVIKEGNGPIPLPNQTVTVHYVGTLENGVKIDSSYDRNEPFKFRLQAGEVIPGWDAGVASMRIGERAKLEIAPADAYGVDGIPGSIPPNATLTFDIELLGVEETPGVPSIPPAPPIQVRFPTQPQPGAVPPRSTVTFDNLPGFVNMRPPQTGGFNPSITFVQPQRPTQNGPDPNIRRLVASNSAFVSQTSPGQFQVQLQSGMPQGGRDIFGNRAMPGQTRAMPAPSFSANGIQQQQPQGIPPGTQFIGQQNFAGQTGTSSPGFRPSGIDGVQFGSQTRMQTPQGIPQRIPQGIPQGMQQGMTQGMQQGMAQGMQQGMPQGMPQGMAPQQMQGASSGIGMQMGPRGPTGATGPTGTTGFRQGSPFPQGPGAGMSPSGGPGELAARRAMEQRIMAARRMGMFPGDRPGLTGDFGGRPPRSMEEMIAMRNMAMRGGPPRNGIPPEMRAMMAMRARMERDGIPPAGIRRPSISPFVARRMMSRRRLFP